MAGSSNTLIILVVVAMCVSSSSCAMSVIGPFGGLFSGLSSLFGGAGNAVSKATKPKLKKIEDPRFMGSLRKIAAAKNKNK